MLFHSVWTCWLGSARYPVAPALVAGICYCQDTLIAGFYCLDPPPRLTLEADLMTWLFDDAESALDDASISITIIARPSIARWH